MDVYTIIVILGFVIAIGTVIGKLVEKIKLPAITGYVVAGVFLGPVFGIITDDVKSGLEVLSNIAIAFIAFTMGTELWLPKLKKSGKQILIMTIFQALITFGVVIIVFLIFQQPLWLALILGAIASATAPSPIIMIVKSYEAKGEMTDAIVPLTGIDDAISIILFGVSLALGVSLASGASLSITSAIIEPLLEIVFSTIAGLILGFLLGIISKYHIQKQDKNEKRTEYLEFVLIVVFIAVALSHYGISGLFGLESINISSVLTPMICGFTFTNMINKDNYIQQSKAVDLFTAPLLVAFFTLAGADLTFEVLKDPIVIMIALIYVVARSAGKIYGCKLGAKVAKAPKSVQKYLGYTLLPQGGVEIGLIISTVAAFKAVGLDTEGTTIQTVVILGIFVFEIIGPILTKFYLDKNHELHYKDVKGEIYHF